MKIMGFGDIKMGGMEVGLAGESS